MKRTNCKTRTYTALYDAEHDEQMMVDIVDDGEYFHAWIYAESNGIKNYMFGLNKSSEDSNTLTKAKKIILANLPQYIAIYWEDDDDLVLIRSLKDGTCPGYKIVAK